MEQVLFCSQKRRGLQNEKREVLEQKREAERYQDKEKEVNELKTKLVLFQLFHHKQKLESHQETVDAYAKDIDKVEEDITALDLEIKEKKIAQAKALKELNSREKKYKEAQNKLDKLQPKVIKVNEEIKSL